MKTQNMVPFIGIVCVTFGLVLCVYYFFLICRRNRLQSELGLCVDEENTFEVVKLVEALREICPPGSGRGWTLLPLVSEIRCWKRILPFEFLKSKIQILACSTIIEHSATSLLNVVADIYTWSDWETSAQQQRHLEAEISDDPDLHGDRYMQCDQVIAMTAGQNPKPGILMHRFGNLEANGVGWILMWHIRQLDWSFYLAQPVETESSLLEETNRCLLTVVRGVSPYMQQHSQPGGGKSSGLSKEDQAGQLVAKLLNLRHAIQVSPLQLRPFLPIIPVPRCSLNNPHLPTIRSALYDLTDAPCVLLRTCPDKEGQSEEVPDHKQKKHLLAVVPFSLHCKPVTLQSLRGFVLVPWPNRDRQSGTSHEKKSRSNSGNSSERLRRRAQRPHTPSKHANGVVNGIPLGDALPYFSNSSSTTSPQSETQQQSQQFSSSLSAEEGFLSSPGAASFFSNLFRRRSSDASNCSQDEMGKHPRRNSSTSLLVSLLQRTSPPVRGYASDGETTLKVPSLDLFINNNNPDEKINLLEDMGSIDDSDKDKEKVVEDCSDTSSVQDMIIVVPQLPRRMEDASNYEVIGESCASEVLREVQKASVINMSTPQQEQKKLSGGWVCEGIHKDILVLMKMTTDGSLRTISYLSKGVVPATPQIIWKTISNPLTRFMYDETVKKVTVVADLCKNQKIIYTYHESVSLLKRDSQDFCLLQTEQKDESHFVLAMQSVDYSKQPPCKDTTRGTLLPSGWIVEAMPENRKCSLVTYLIQLTVHSCDSMIIEEMGTTQCVSKLRSYLGSRLVA